MESEQKGRRLQSPLKVAKSVDLADERANFDGDVIRLVLMALRRKRGNDIVELITLNSSLFLVLSGQSTVQNVYPLIRSDFLLFYYSSVNFFFFNRRNKVLNLSIW